MAVSYCVDMDNCYSKAPSLCRVGHGRFQDSLIGKITAIKLFSDMNVLILSFQILSLA